MKTNRYLIFPIILLLFTSCYIYKPYSEKEVDENAKDQNLPGLTPRSIRNESSSETAVQKTRSDQGNNEVSAEEKEAQDKKEAQRNQQMSNSNFGRAEVPPELASNNTKSISKSTIQKADDSAPIEKGIKGKLQPNKYYKITALGNQYKIQVDKWEGDTLVSHKIRKPEKVYRHHMNDIEEEAILERRFSKPFSDLLTVGAYASGAAIVLLLVL